MEHAKMTDPANGTGSKLARCARCGTHPIVDGGVMVPQCSCAPVRSMTGDHPIRWVVDLELDQPEEPSPGAGDRLRDMMVGWGHLPREERPADRMRRDAMEAVRDAAWVQAISREAGPDGKTVVIRLVMWSETMRPGKLPDPPPFPKGCALKALCKCTGFEPGADLSFCPHIRRW